MNATYLIVKLFLSAGIIVAVSEIAKRLPLIGALVASLPLTSILAMIWLYRDTKDVAKVIDLSQGILVLILPSLVLFVALPFLLKRGWDFSLSLFLACALTAGTYLVYMRALKHFGIA